MKKCQLNIVLQSFRRLSSESGQTVAYKQQCYGPMETIRTEMLNGTKIIAARTSGSLMVACTIMFQAGSRYEVKDDLGATHFIRAASTGSGCGSSAFAKLRQLQQKGGYLTCTSDRQTVAYTLRCPLPYYHELKHHLLDAAARCCYHEWEITDRKQLVRGDLTRVHPEQRVIDLVQKACWAGPLANSIFCEDERIDSMSGEKLRYYAQTNFKSSHCSVASVGLPFKETVKLAAMIDSRTMKPPPTYRQTPSVFRSGIECYDLGPGHDTWIAMAVRGCGTDDLENLFRHAILASACGTGTMVEGQHELDRIPQSSPGLLDGDIFTNYKAFNISYVDTGVFGIVAKTRASTANKVVHNASKFLTILNEISSKQIEDGKKRLQVNLALHDEDCAKVCEGFALAVVNDVIIEGSQNAIDMIDSICHDEIISTGKDLSAKCDKMALAVVGDVGAVSADLFNSNQINSSC